MLYFEWGAKKEQINIEKHGPDLAEASRIFYDPGRIEYYDVAHSTSEEDRYITIGRVRRIITLVYTRRHEKIRIISAHLSTKKERSTYLQWQ